MQKIKKPSIQLYLRSNKNSYCAVEDGYLDMAFLVTPADPVGKLNFIKINALEVKVNGLKSKFEHIKSMTTTE